MIITEEIEKVITGSAFITLVTQGANGDPHPIIAGKGEIVGDTVVFGIYKMEVTQKNLAKNPNAWLVACTMTDGPKGFRLTGTAAARDKQLIFTPVNAEAMI